jgi:hypothetical protein
MDFETAQRFLIAQTIEPKSEQTPFIECLRRGTAPVPGQVTSILLALKTLSQALQGEPKLEKSMAHVLFVLTYESRRLYDQGLSANVDWPPLLNEDLQRIADAVRSILADQAV